MERSNKLMRFLSGKVGGALFTFFLTVVCAGLFGLVVQTIAEERQRDFLIMQRALDKEETLITEIANLLSNRLFALERLNWSLESDAQAAFDLQDQTSLKNFRRERWDEYYAAVTHYNSSFRRNFALVKVFSTKDVANEFDCGKPNCGWEKCAYRALSDSHTAIRDLYKKSLAEPQADTSKLRAEVTTKIEVAKEAVDDALNQLCEAINKNRS